MSALFVLRGPRSTRRWSACIVRAHASLDSTHRWSAGILPSSFPFAPRQPAGPSGTIPLPITTEIMRFAPFRTALAGCLFLTLLICSATAQPRRNSKNSLTVPPDVLLLIIRAEDERRWDNTLPVFLLDTNPNVRKRAALAMGRIGNAEALPALFEVLKTDPDNEVRQSIVFAIGEIESPEGTAALIDIVQDTSAPAEVRARAVEALGKIGGALLNDATAAASAPNKQVTKIRLAILDALKFEAGRRSAPDRLSILLGLTAALRTKPDDAGPVIARFLSFSDPRIIADALNALARLRLKDGNGQARELLVKHSDPIVRANAARVLGSTEDKQAFDMLLDRALHDSDLRVRVSAIRALGSLKNERAAEPLTKRAEELSWKAQGEMLEIFTALGNIFVSKGGDDRPKLLGDSPMQLSARGLIIAANVLRAGADQPEVHIAAAKVNPRDYLQGVLEQFRRAEQDPLYPFRTWRRSSSIAQGLRAMSAFKADTYGKDIANTQMEAQARLRLMVTDPHLLNLAIPEVMQAYSSFKPLDIGNFLRSRLGASDVIIRATAAEMLGELPAEDATARVLIEALPRALRDKDLNDAALAILDTLAKQKSKEANDAIKTALDSSDHLIRRKAVALLKANGVGDFSDRIGTVKTHNTDADYRRAIALIGKKVTATVVTSKGSFVIEFLPEEAPLTVDNFIQLAKKGFFNGQTIPRVVPNFVIQAGDPRGDTNGGPGYQIRCEINEVSYERGTVGMALSGKDTGGSQWFVTHSPQPHLDGGYTVFGRVIRGMEVVDNIARGDVIRRVVINER